MVRRTGRRAQQVGTAAQQRAGLVSAFGSRGAVFAAAQCGVGGTRVRVVETGRGTEQAGIVLDRGVGCTSLAWDGQALWIGLSTGDILVFSAAEDRVVARLGGGHSAAVGGVAFAGDGRAWSVGADGRAVVWEAGKAVGEALCAVACSGDEVVAVSDSIYVCPGRGAGWECVGTHVCPVDALAVWQGAEGRRVGCGAADERFVSVLGADGQALLAAGGARRIVAVPCVADGTHGFAVAVVTAEGRVEVFQEVPGGRPQKAVLRVWAAGEIVDACVEDGWVVVAVVVGAGLGFGRAVCLEGGVLREGEVEVEVVGAGGPRVCAEVGVPGQAGAAGLLGLGWHAGASRVGVRAVRAGRRVRVGRARRMRGQLAGRAIGGQGWGWGWPGVEANAAVVGGDEVDGAESSDTADDAVRKRLRAEGRGEAEQQRDRTEKTLEERLEALEVREDAVEVPTAGSLASVLVQALQLNDRGQLDSCLSCGDSETVLGTVRRLSAEQAVVLLERIGEGLCRGRKAGVLNTWIRWTVVVHGGQLVALPGLMKSLSSLQMALQRRASALPRLLALHGRLEMINAQMRLRRECVVESESGSEEYVEGESEGAVEDAVEDAGDGESGEEEAVGSGTGESEYETLEDDMEDDIEDGTEDTEGSGDSSELAESGDTDGTGGDGLSEDGSESSGGQAAKKRRGAGDKCGCRRSRAGGAILGYMGVFWSRGGCKRVCGAAFCIEGGMCEDGHGTCILGQGRSAVEIEAEIEAERRLTAVRCAECGGQRCLSQSGYGCPGETIIRLRSSEKIMASDTKHFRSKGLYSRIKNVPLELYPLGAVLAVGLGGRHGSRYLGWKRCCLVVFSILYIIFQLFLVVTNHLYTAACYQLVNKLFYDPGVRYK
ncbi:hypothetical protein PMAC_001199 [Pneumocystis sp. 'macacae']|nr:hypothetical protein PMAC_001199 [Pneumocystis sp. 'macacae']